MKRYRVESKSKKTHFRVDCYQNELDYWKAICKLDAMENKGICYYREFPVSKNEKVYYAKDNKSMNTKEIDIIREKFKIIYH